jgi:hypothetical protein
MQNSFAHRHGQPQFPACPIFKTFTHSIQKAIRRNPLGAITLAAEVIAEKEQLFNYIDSLPIPENIRMEIAHILTLEYINHK